MPTLASLGVVIDPTGAQQGGLTVIEILTKMAASADKMAVAAESMAKTIGTNASAAGTALNAVVPVADKAKASIDGIGKEGTDALGKELVNGAKAGGDSLGSIAEQAKRSQEMMGGLQRSTQATDTAFKQISANTWAAEIDGRLVKIIDSSFAATAAAEREAKAQTDLGNAYRNTSAAKGAAPGGGGPPPGPGGGGPPGGGGGPPNNPNRPRYGLASDYNEFMRKNGGTDAGSDVAGAEREAAARRQVGEAARQAGQEQAKVAQDAARIAEQAARDAATAAKAGEVEKAQAMRQTAAVAQETARQAMNSAKEYAATAKEAYTDAATAAKAAGTDAAAIQAEAARDAASATKASAAEATTAYKEAGTAAKQAATEAANAQKQATKESTQEVKSQTAASKEAATAAKALAKEQAEAMSKIGDKTALTNLTGKLHESSSLLFSLATLFGPLQGHVMSFAGSLSSSALALDKVNNSTKDQKGQLESLSSAIEKANAAKATLASANDVVATSEAMLQTTQKAEVEAMRGVTEAQTRLLAARRAEAASSQEIAGAEATATAARKTTNEAIAAQEAAERALEAARMSGKASATDIQANEAALVQARKVADDAAKAETTSENALKAAKAQGIATTAQVKEAELALAAAKKEQAASSEVVAGAERALATAEAEATAAKEADAVATKAVAEANETAALTAGSFIAAVAPMVLLLASVAVVLGTAVAAYKFFKASLTAGIEFNDLHARFSQFVGDAKLAHTELERLQQLGGQAGLTLPDLELGEQRLLAFGESLKDAQEDITAFATLAAQQGKDAIQALSNSFTTARDQGYANMMQIRQLRTVGVDLYPMLTKETGLMGVALRQYIADGNLSFGKLREAILGAAKDSDALKIRMSTPKGLMFDIGTQWDALLDKFGKPIVESLVPFLRTVDEKIKAMAPSAEAYGNKASMYLDAITESIREGNLGTLIMESFKPLGKMLWSIINGDFLTPVEKWIQDHFDFAQWGSAFKAEFFNLGALVTKWFSDGGVILHAYLASFISDFQVMLSKVPLPGFGDIAIDADPRSPQVIARDGLAQNERDYQAKLDANGQDYRRTLAENGMAVGKVTGFLGPFGEALNLVIDKAQGIVAPHPTDDWRRKNFPEDYKEPEPVPSYGVHGPIPQRVMTPATALMSPDPMDWFNIPGMSLGSGFAGPSNLAPKPPLFPARSMPSYLSQMADSPTPGPPAKGTAAPVMVEISSASISAFRQSLGNPKITDDQVVQMMKSMTVMRQTGPNGQLAPVAAAATGGRVVSVSPNGTVSIAGVSNSASSLSPLRPDGTNGAAPNLGPVVAPLAANTEATKAQAAAVKENTEAVKGANTATAKTAAATTSLGTSISGVSRDFGRLTNGQIDRYPEGKFKDAHSEHYGAPIFGDVNLTTPGLMGVALSGEQAQQLTNARSATEAFKALNGVMLTATNTATGLQTQVRAIDVGPGKTPAGQSAIEMTGAANRAIGALKGDEHIVLSMPGGTVNMNNGRQGLTGDFDADMKALAARGKPPELEVKPKTPTPEPETFGKIQTDAQAVINLSTRIAELTRALQSGYMKPDEYNRRVTADRAQVIGGLSSPGGSFSPDGGKTFTSFQDKAMEGDEDAVRRKIAYHEFAMAQIVADQKQAEELMKTNDEGYVNSFIAGMKRQAQSVGTLQQTIAKVGNTLVSGLTSGVAGALASIANGSKTAAQAFKEMAASILSDISKMIIEFVLLAIIKQLAGVGGTAATNAGYSGLGSSLTSFSKTGSFHTGGIVGGSAPSYTSVNPAVFDGAARYHTGGMVGGLRAGEVPIVAKTGEGVFTPEQMRSLAPVASTRSTQNNNVQSTFHAEYHFHGDGSQQSGSTKGSNSDAQEAGEQLDARIRQVLTAETVSHGGIIHDYLGGSARNKS